MKRAFFYGPPGSGKSTLAKSMQRYYGGSVIPFAEALREEVYKSHDITMQDLTTVPEKYKHRTLLQMVGSDRRKEDADYWVKRWIEKFDRQLGFGTKTFWVDDARYDNEFTTLTGRGFVVIECLPNPDGDAIKDEERDHESERDWKLWSPDIKMEWRARPSIRVAELVLKLNGAENDN